MNEIHRLRKLEKLKNEINGYEVSVIVYDSCEYIVIGNGYSQAITHKGNCKYCRDANKNNFNTGKTINLKLPNLLLDSITKTTR